MSGTGSLVGLIIALAIAVLLLRAARRPVAGWRAPALALPGLAREAVEAQRAYARERLPWARPRAAVLAAAACAERALETLPPSPDDPDRWIEQAMEALEAARREFREDHEDEDGYGGTVFSEIRARLQAARR